MSRLIAADVCVAFPRLCIGGIAFLQNASGQTCPRFAASCRAKLLWYLLCRNTWELHRRCQNALHSCVAEDKHIVPLQTHLHADVAELRQELQMLVCITACDPH